VADEDRRPNFSGIPTRRLNLSHCRHHSTNSKCKADWIAEKRSAMRDPYSVSKPWLSNFKVRLFSVTVRTS
jgi:hypothetical protein